jgi:hypothetical protein
MFFELVLQETTQEFWPVYVNSVNLVSNEFLLTTVH